MPVNRANKPAVPATMKLAAANGKTACGRDSLKGDITRARDGIKTAKGREPQERCRDTKNRPGRDNSPIRGPGT